MIRYLQQSLVFFGVRTLGIVTKPYETFRAIVDHARYEELGILALIVAVYFSVASIVKTSLFRPYLLTKQWIVLMAGFVSTFIIVIGLFWCVSALFGRSGKLKGFVVSWGYTLLPTVVWFWMTSFLYILLPPPRSTNGTGILFSALYLLISIALLFWKITLSYLALRFGLRLDLAKISLLSAIVLPLLGLYSVLMYRIGVFRIPFI